MKNIARITELKKRQETAAEIEISLESQKKLTILGKVRSSLASTVTI